MAKINGDKVGKYKIRNRNSETSRLGFIRDHWGRGRSGDCGAIFAFRGPALAPFYPGGVRRLKLTSSSRQGIPRLTRIGAQRAGARNVSAVGTRRGIEVHKAAGAVCRAAIAN